MRLRRRELQLILFGLFAGVVASIGLSRVGSLIVSRIPATRDLDTRNLLVWMLNPSFFVREGDQFVTNHPSMPRQTFSVHKSPQDFRVFIVGESQAMGVPYVQMQSELVKISPYMQSVSAEGGVATFLQEYLQRLEPDRRVQVVNAAIANQNMESAAATVEQIVEVGNPDLIVVLAGNGESYNVRYRSLEELNRTVDRLSEKFAGHLARISTAVNTHGVPTYVLTVPTNLRDWLPYYEAEAKASRFLLEQDWTRAAAVMVDAETNFAVRHYLLAKAPSSAVSNTALDEYRLAKDSDFNLIRAHSRLNDVIRRAGGGQVKILDLEVAMRQYAAGGVPGFDLLHDYCHLTLRGNVLAAREVALFHQRVTGRPVGGLPILDLPERLRAKIRRIYKLELRRWKRLIHLDIPNLVEVNAVRVEEQFRRLNKEQRLAAENRR